MPLSENEIAEVRRLIAQGNNNDRLREVEKKLDLMQLSLGTVRVLEERIVTLFKQMEAANLTAKDMREDLQASIHDIARQINTLSEKTNYNSFFLLWFDRIVSAGMGALVYLIVRKFGFKP